MPDCSTNSLLLLLILLLLLLLQLPVLLVIFLLLLLLHLISADLALEEGDDDEELLHYVALDGSERDNSPTDIVGTWCLVVQQPQGWDASPACSVVASADEVEGRMAEDFRY